MRKSKISMGEFEMLALLLKREYSVKSALDYLINEQKITSLVKVQYGLDSGKAIDECLCDSKDEKQIALYSKYIPLAEAIEIVLEQNAKKRERKKYLINKCGYNVILILFSFAILTLFVKIIMPRFSDMYTFNESLSAVKILKALYYIKIGCEILVLICIIAFVYLSKRIKSVWALLHKYNLDKILKKVATIRFAKEFIIIFEKGISIKDGLEIIKNYSEDSLARILAFRIEEKLNKGYSFQGACQDKYVDNTFYTLCLYGIKDLDLAKGIHNYIVISENKNDRFMNKSMLIFRIISYLIVALTIVTLYQVLLLPLELLGEIL